jgi:hypothetical protein
MKHTQKEVVKADLTPGQLYSAIDLVEDQLTDLRIKLQAEKDSNLQKVRFASVTHYRNLRRSLLNKLDPDEIMILSAIGVLHHN